MKYIPYFSFKLIFISFFYFFFHNQSALASQSIKNKTVVIPSKTASASKSNLQKPKLKPNQYTLNKDNKITIFNTRSFEGLTLSESCFTKKNVNCEAYQKSIQKTNTQPKDHMKTPYHNNFGAIHCELIGGKSLIAKTFDGNDDDFCQFNDGSMVSSWSAYYKTHPPTQTK